MATRPRTGRPSETGSRRSRRSSAYSQLSITAAEARADAAMQLARIQFAKEKARAKVEATKANADYEVLLQEEAAAVADARSKVLDQQLDDLAEELSDDSLDNAESSRFIQDYVNSLPDQHVLAKSNPMLDRSSPAEMDFSRQVSTISTPTPEAATVSDILKGMMKLHARRDIVSTCIPTFDDQPENFRAWKLSLKNAIDDIPLSPSEEMNIMLKFAGPESAEIVRRARAVHISNPKKGLGVVWEPLAEKYGTPEIVTTTLINKLFNFPDILKSQHEKLRSFGDAIQMVEQARLDGGLPGLDYLDTFMGINPLVAKLQQNLQEKWRSKAFRYKQEHDDKFPTFAFFSKFIVNLAKERNDRSLMTSTDETEWRKQSSSRSTRILTKLTGVTKAHDSVTTSDGDVDVKCPIHNTRHPLCDCRTFMNMPLGQKWLLLRELNICFRCAASTSHIARNCQANVICSSCQSTRHIDALHTEDQATETHGGEQAVSSKCTQVCGKNRYGRSCSKICLGRVYVEGKPETAVTTYIVLDDQSNRSLAKSKLFDLLNVKSDPVPYTLKTCSGVVNSFGRSVAGLVIESIDGHVTTP